ncbi:YlbF family regulator [Ornithinibacillus salinisoli]|uniref:YlbF family regulator n=1 Tax=Ornithinibacillus salinisoli TaxID=1848459 RepID=A0ABW4VZ31_9BACI
MIATLEYVDLLDRAELLGDMIIHSDVVKAFQKARHDLNTDPESQMLIKAFNDIKEQYEEVQRFGRYHPDYNEIMKEVRTSKREMDLNDKVASYKIAERNLQKLLDEISGYIAHSVSKDIKVPKDGAALSDGGCGCGSGGSCGCKAS